MTFNLIVCILTVCRLSIQIFYFEEVIFMADAIKEDSSMAKRLDAVFKRCGNIKGNQIAVPKDVEDRMKVLCKETEKIIKDIPNKKFSAAAKINRNSKAVSYYNEVKEGIDKAYINIKSFYDLMKFYGIDSEKKVKKGALKYSNSMNDCFNKIQTIIGEISSRLEKNPKIVKGIGEKEGQGVLKDDKKIALCEGIENIVADTHEKDNNLIRLGKIVEDLNNIENLEEINESYENNVKAFLKYIIEYKVDYSIFKYNKEEPRKEETRKGVGLVQLFKDASYSFRRLKLLVSENENEVYENGGIRNAKGYAVSRMKIITNELNKLSGEIDESITFLQDLETESSSINKKRVKIIKELNDKKKSYTKQLDKVNGFKSSLLYGETVIKSTNGNEKFAAGEILDANSVRKSCNGFVSRLSGFLDEIKAGERIENIPKDIKILYGEVARISEDVVEFIRDINNFKGYYKKNEKSKSALNKVMVIYVKTGKEFDSMIKKIDYSKTKDKLESMQEKLQSELEDYNKTSSKIKRGAKKVGIILLTMGKYALYVKSFMNTLVGFSNDCVLLLSNIKRIEKQIEGQEVEVPIINYNLRM